MDALHSEKSADTATALDTLGRRSRFARTKTGKRIVLGPRDIEILAALHRYRYLHKDQLLALLSPKSKKRFTERLGDLFHEAGLINRLKTGQCGIARFGSPMLYELADRGLANLESMGPLLDRAVLFSRRRRRSDAPQMPHTLLVIETLLGIELAARARKGERFVPVDEILRKSPEATRRLPNPLRIPVVIRPSPAFPQVRSAMETHIIPDALYGIEYLIDGERRYRFFALECERTTPRWRNSTGATSIALKRAAYDALIRSGAFKRHFDIPNMQLSLLIEQD